jgi:hypothetical protein
MVEARAIRAAKALMWISKFLAAVVMAGSNLSSGVGRQTAAVPFFAENGLASAYLPHWQSLHLQHLHSVQLQLAHLQQPHWLLPADDMLAG